jgi:hypothetical protein
VHWINYRYGGFNTVYESRIYSVQFFESIVAFSINPEKCNPSKPTLNKDATTEYDFVDYRYGEPTSKRFRKIVYHLKGNPYLFKIVKKLYIVAFNISKRIKNISDRNYYKRKIFLKHKKF